MGRVIHKIVRSTSPRASGMKRGRGDPDELLCKRAASLLLRASPRRSMLNQGMPQIDLKFRTWGGRRKGAGRKPKGDNAGVPHVPRAVLKPRFPVHVTWRM